MPLPPRDFNTIGPKEGQRFPDVRLSDQTGALVDLHEKRDAGRAAEFYAGHRCNGAPAIRIHRQGSRLRL